MHNVNNWSAKLRAVVSRCTRIKSQQRRLPDTCEFITFDRPQQVILPVTTPSPDTHTLPSQFTVRRGGILNGSVIFTIELESQITKLAGGERATPSYRGRLLKKIQVYVWVKRRMIWFGLISQLRALSWLPLGYTTNPFLKVGREYRKGLEGWPRVKGVAFFHRVDLSLSLSLKSAPENARRPNSPLSPR